MPLAQQTFHYGPIGLSSRDVLKSGHNCQFYLIAIKPIIQDMLKSLLVLLALAASSHASSRHTGDIVELSEGEVPFAVSLPPKALDNAMLEPAAFFKHFRPAGTEMTHFTSTIDAATKLPELGFQATVGKGIASLSAHVAGVLTLSRVACESASGEKKGYRLVLDLSKSDDLIKNNAAALMINLCPALKDGKLVSVKARTSMQVGADYGTFSGPMSVRALAQQTKPLIEAFSAVMTDAANKLLVLGLPDGGFFPPGPGARECP